MTDYYCCYSFFSLWPPVELRIETYERLPPVATGDTPVVTGGLRWVSSTGSFFLFFSSDNRAHPVCSTFYFSTDFNRLRGTQRSRVRVPAFARNVFVHLRKRTSLKSPLLIFFRHCATFFRNFSHLPSKFWIFGNKPDFAKQPWVFSENSSEANPKCKSFKLSTV